MTAEIAVPQETYEALQSEEIYLYGRPAGPAGVPAWAVVKPLLGFPTPGAMWESGGTGDTVVDRLDFIDIKTGQVTRSVPFRTPGRILMAPGSKLWVEYRVTVEFGR